jgi:AraC-like DNA-binding protein
MADTIYVKNMVCPRCIDTVDDIFKKLKIKIASVELGEVVISETISATQRSKLKLYLESRGFELLQDYKSKLISQIKAIIIAQIHKREGGEKFKFSDLISNKLNHEYSSLSKLFSSVEGITIERFILKQKIERVKELLFYNQLTLSQIAFQMDYSSVAHLSSQFKKETGMTPTNFKALRKPGHQSLDFISPI